MKLIITAIIFFLTFIVAALITYGIKKWANRSSDRDKDKLRVLVKEKLSIVLPIISLLIFLFVIIIMKYFFDLPLMELLDIVTD